MFAAASAARFAVRHRMPTIASVDHTGTHLKKETNFNNAAILI